MWRSERLAGVGALAAGGGIEHGGKNIGEEGGQGGRALGNWSCACRFFGLLGLCAILERAGRASSVCCWVAPLLAGVGVGDWSYDLEFVTWSCWMVLLFVSMLMRYVILSGFWLSHVFTDVELLCNEALV